MCESETDIPSVASASAARRLSGVIRLTAPSWSSSPQRPQLESPVIQVSTVSAVTVRDACASIAGAAAISVATTALATITAATPCVLLIVMIVNILIPPRVNVRLHRE